MSHTISIICALLISTLYLSGCSVFQRRSSTVESPSSQAISTSNEAQTDERLPIGSDLEGYQAHAHYGNVNLDVNKKVLKWVNYWKGRGRPHMQRYLSRSTKYLPIMKKVLRKHGLPQDLSYVVLIESGFNPKAHSFAAAVGFWQFISATGKRYGLKIDRYQDERMDPELSSEAAAKYLTALYGIFGDWHLSLAAYNTGEGRVKRVVRRHRTKDFWKVSAKHRRGLARETRNYVPKFIAAALIAKNPKRYGFNDVDYQETLAYENVALTGSISMDKLAKEMGVPYESIRELNPRYRSDLIPMGRGVTNVKVPVGAAGLARSKLFAAAAVKPVRKLAVGYLVHRVRRGDSLSRIAHRYRTRVSTLRRVNKLRRRSYLRIGQRLKVPNRYGALLKERVAKKGDSSRRRIKSKRLKRRVVASRKSSINGLHTVRSGENLTLIARKYDITVNQLRRWNGLKRRYILKTGTRLRVLSRGQIHIVRRGENLSTIARKYSVHVRKLAQANSIRNRSRINVGASLVIPE